KHAAASEFIAFRELGADEAGLDPARGRATISVRGVAVVTLLFDQQAVATFRGTRISAAGRFGLAGRRATVKGLLVAVITSLGSFLKPITADGRCAHAGSAVTLETGLELTACGAAVTGLGPAIVALLGGGEDAVAAHHQLLTRFTRRVAGIASFGCRAVCVATVCANRVAIVARLALGQDAVSTGISRSARTGRRAAWNWIAIDLQASAGTANAACRTSVGRAVAAEAAAGIGSLFVASGRIIGRSAAGDHGDAKRCACQTPASQAGLNARQTGARHLARARTIR